MTKLFTTTPGLNCKWQKRSESKKIWKIIKWKCNSVLRRVNTQSDLTSKKCQTIHELWMLEKRGNIMHKIEVFHKLLKQNATKALTRQCGEEKSTSTMKPLHVDFCGKPAQVLFVSSPTDRSTHFEYWQNSCVLPVYHWLQ